MTFIAYYFHWSHQEVMSLEHRVRRRYCDEISAIHKQMDKGSKNLFDV